MVKPIAHSYWRRIKDNARTYSSVPDNVKPDVKFLADEEVKAGTLSKELYEELIGEAYPTEEA